MAIFDWAAQRPGRSARSDRCPGTDVILHDGRAEQNRRRARPVPDPVSGALAILRDRRVKMSELADYLGLDKSTLSGLVDRAGSAASPADTEPGRRTRRGRVPSTIGTGLAERGAIQVARALSPMTGRLTPAEARRLTTLLETMLGPG